MTGNPNSKTVTYRDGQSDRPRERGGDSQSVRDRERDNQRPRGLSEGADAIVHLARLHSPSVSVFRLAVRGWSVRGIGRVGNWIVVHVLSCGGKVCERVRACVRARARARVCVCVCAGVLTST